VTNLSTLGVAHLSDAVPADLRQALNAQIDQWIDDFDPMEHRASFSSGGAHLEHQRYFLDSARQVSCFLETGAWGEDGQLIQPKHQAINKIGHALHDHSAAFAQLARLPSLSRHLTQISDQPWELMQTMVIMKPPRIGGEVNWHQDGTFLMDSANGCLGIWIALEDADPENGCLQFGPTPEHGLSELFETDHETGESQMRQIHPTALQTPSKPVFAPCKAGDAVVFDGLTPHASSPNTSDRSRRAITLHFKPAHSDWLATNWLQRGELQPFLVP